MSFSSDFTFSHVVHYLERFWMHVMQKWIGESFFHPIRVVGRPRAHQNHIRNHHFGGEDRRLLHVHHDEYIGETHQHKVARKAISQRLTRLAI